MIVVRERKANPVDKNDLLGKMLEGKDPKTGESLSDRAITNNVGIFILIFMRVHRGSHGFSGYFVLKLLTFLIAGEY